MMASNMFFSASLMFILLCLTRVRASDKDHAKAANTMVYYTNCLLDEHKRAAALTEHFDPTVFDEFIHRHSILIYRKTKYIATLSELFDSEEDKKDFKMVKTRFDRFKEEIKSWKDAGSEDADATVARQLNQQSDFIFRLLCLIVDANLETNYEQEFDDVDGSGSVGEEPIKGALKGLVAPVDEVECGLVRQTRNDRRTRLNALDPKTSEQTFTEVQLVEKQESLKRALGSEYKEENLKAENTKVEKLKEAGKNFWSKMTSAFKTSKEAKKGKKSKKEKKKDDKRIVTYTEGTGGRLKRKVTKTKGLQVVRD